MDQQHFSIGKRIESFKYAFNGVIILFKEEHNSRIHLFAAIVAVSLGFYFNINIIEWTAIIFSIGLVFL
ncbi:MAG: diacylglycerol kinase family protein, partial [Bacteroidota bacterium]